MGKQGLSRGEGDSGEKEEKGSYVHSAPSTGALTHPGLQGASWLCPPRFGTELFGSREGWSVVFVLFSSVQSLSHVRLFATPWTAAHEASLFITNS